MIPPVAGLLLAAGAASRTIGAPVTRFVCPSPARRREAGAPMTAAALPLPGLLLAAGEAGVLMIAATPPMADLRPAARKPVSR